MNLSRHVRLPETEEYPEIFFHCYIINMLPRERLWVVDALWLYDVAKPHVGGVFRECARRQDLAAARRAVWLGYDPDDFELLFAQ